MSIHVTVSSNPVCISRSKVLLADLEQAKKNEWNRRRKLRLQQVRQQSRDLANILRKKCNAEKKLQQQQENEGNETELKQWQGKQLQKLQEAYEEGLAAMGTAHRSAHSEIEKDENIKEKQELRDALAKARGDLARERAKLLCPQIKPAKVSVKCISNKGKAPSVTTSISQGLESNKNKNIPLKSKIKQKSGVEYTKKIEINENLPTECTISSPGHNIKLQFNPKTIRPTTPKTIRRQRSHSPSRSSVSVKDVCVDSSDDSEDSNVTWPPRSTHISKINYSPSKVKLYNHDQRISKEYIKSCKSVTHIDSQENEEMEKYIEEEEEASVKKSEFDASIKKRCETRGQQALRKERLEREFKTLEQQYSEVNKQQRIARIFEFPYPFKETKERKLNKENENKNKFSNAIPSTSKEPDKRTSIEGKTALDTSAKSGKPAGGNTAQDLNKCFEVAALKEKKADKKPDGSIDLSFSPNPFTLKKLIKDLEKERDLLLNSSVEKSFLEDFDSSFKADVKEDSIRVGKYPGNSGERRLSGAGGSRDEEKPPYPLEVNVIEKPLCNCCDQCTCPNKINKTQREDNNGNFDQNMAINIENEDQSSTFLEQSFNKEKLPTSPKTIQQKNLIEKSVPSCVQLNGNSSSDAEVVSTICANDIKITVKVKEKNKKLTCDDQSLIEIENGENEIPWRNRLNGPIDNINSSSSYCSPPNKLSPAQESVLNSILLKMCLKNNNPRLHKYIKRLLFMKKSKIDELTVSSPSEVSVQSDLFNNNLDNITGTYQLKEPSSSPSKHVKIVESKGDPKKSSSVKKKIIHLNSSSEDSTTHERSPIPKESSKPSKVKTLADEYSSRLKELIQLLNQVSPKVVRGSELNDNYESSSYICPPLERSPLLERFSSSNGYDSNITLIENENTNVNFENRYDNNFQSENQQPSAYTRNDITSLGLPFELLPKPFSLEQEDKGESSKPKPPVSSNKYRVDGYLPHELSAIPEVSSRICSRNQGQQLTVEERDYSDLNEEYLTDIDLLDLSSIKDTPIKIIKQQNLVESRESVDNLQCIQIDTSSLSILSQMTNESQIDIKSDSNSNLDTSSSDYIEEVFRSLGVGWALSTLKKTREARQIDSTSSSPSNNSYIMIERKRSKSNSRTKVNRSHSTPKKLAESQQTLATTVDEDIHKKFKALKNDRLSLTPPDLTLKIPNLGSYE